jgi:hypothetical protein
MGGVYVNGPFPPEVQMTEIDFISDTTFYTFFNITGNKLTIATASGTEDGTTPAKRAFQVGYSDPTYIKQ